MSEISAKLWLRAKTKNGSFTGLGFYDANAAKLDELAADEIDRLTRELAEAREDRDYWKVEAEGERAKVEFRDKKLAQYETLHAVAGFARALKERP